MKKNLLVVLADENYVRQAKQLFSSVYWNAGWKGDYMLLSYKIPEKELKWFRKKGILIKKCLPLYPKNKLTQLYNESFAENKQKFNVNYLSVILSKFSLFTPEFKKWKKIVYLDLDIIVRSSLEELTKVESFAAVLDPDKPDILKSQFINKNKFLFNEFKKKYNLKEKAFNSGVMAFSTNIIQENTLTQLKKLFEKYNKIRKMNDQTIFNLFFYKKWKSLPLIYNISPRPPIFPLSDEKKKEKIKGAILHFTGKVQPWQRESPFYNEWENNLDKAEKINLKKIQRGKSWTKQEILNYEKYLEKKSKISFYKKPIWELKQAIDRGIGLVGIFLRRNYPRLYYKLKKTRK